MFTLYGLFAFIILGKPAKKIKSQTWDICSGLYFFCRLPLCLLCYIIACLILIYFSFRLYCLECRKCRKIQEMNKLRGHLLLTTILNWRYFIWIKNKNISVQTKWMEYSLLFKFINPRNKKCSPTRLLGQAYCLSQSLSPRLL